MERRNFLTKTAIGTIAFTGATKLALGDSQDPDRPNIVWIFAEDICPDLSCYGTKGVHTPNLDRLADEGVRYDNAFVTAPVCSAARSAMMTGCHQNFIGSNQHRTAKKTPLPDPVEPFPLLLQKAGYFTSIPGKNDLNFTHKPLSTGKGIDERTKGQPFFLQKTFGSTHRSFIREDDDSRLQNIELPPYYPDVQLSRRDWGNYLNTVEHMDRQVGKFLDQLERKGLSDNTMVIFIGDHGRCMPRAKQFLYDSGLHVPLIIRWPDKIDAGSVDKNLVSSIDLAPTILAAAGVEPPQWMHGRNLLNDRLEPRKYVFAARDKMDSTHDAMRAIRSENFKYILNLMPERAYCQFNRYKEQQYPMLALLNVMHLQGKLNNVQDRFMQPTKPQEELYDLRQDPYETCNLADNPEYAEVKQILAERLEDWREDIKDQGVTDDFRKGGWPSEYPTRSPQEWEKILEGWRDYLYRDGKKPIAGKYEKPGKNQFHGYPEKIFPSKHN